MGLTRRIEFFLFLVALTAYGWFNQGGGWNQNARFDEVRAIVDGHQLNLDDYLSYSRQGGKMLRRNPIVNGDVTIRGETSRLAWVQDNGAMIPVSGIAPPPGIALAAVDDLGNSGDLSYALGHFHPNKPPGLSFVAVPAYFVLSHFERFMHRSPDSWWLLNVNAWLTSLFSVGIISALGVILAFRLAMRISAGNLWPSFCTALAFGFGTLFFPFGTILFDHDVTAVCLLGAFYFLLCDLSAIIDPAQRIVLAGFLAGMAAITNYIAAVPAGMLGLYLLWTRWHAGKSKRPSSTIRAALLYTLGILGPLIAICAYNRACYGSALAISNHFQNPTFNLKGPMLFGMFSIPSPFVAATLLVSPFRGIFYTAPILVMGLYGLWRMARPYPAETMLFTGIALTFYIVNCSFFGWHAGFACGSRYLIPATAFLAIPCVFGFVNFPRFSRGLLMVSIAANFIFTVTDAENPVGVGSLAMTETRPTFFYNPLMDYAVPLFVEGRAWPMLNELISDKLKDQSDEMIINGIPDADQKPILAKLETDLRQSVRNGEAEPLDLGAYVGPVSVNPTGICEGGYFALFEPGTKEALWNSFNVGEFWFPGSRWSIVPLLAFIGLLSAALAREAQRSGVVRTSRPAPSAIAGEGAVAD